MISKLLSIFGYKEYLVEITWDNGEKEIVPMKAWSPMNAIRKVTETKDVANKAEMTIFNHRKFSKVRHYRDENFGIAKKVNGKERSHD